MRIRFITRNLRLLFLFVSAIPMLLQAQVDLTITHQSGASNIYVFISRSGGDVDQIKYSIAYEDGVGNESDATYVEGGNGILMDKRPATLTVRALWQGSDVGSAEAIYFGFAGNTNISIPFQTSYQAPDIVPAFPFGATITYSSNGGAQSANKINSSTGEISIWDVATETYSATFAKQASPTGSGVAILNDQYTSNGSYDLGEFTLTVTQKPLTDDMISISPASVTYDGGTHTPWVEVKTGIYSFNKNYDYTVSHANDIKNVGDYPVTVTATANGKLSGGPFTKTFSITARSINDAQITLGYTTAQYTGSEQQPSVSVALPSPKGGYDPPLDASNYDVTYANATNVGTATVTVTGKGNYTGSLSTTFTITARGLVSATFGEIASQTYTGSAIAPEPTVTWIPATGGPGTQLVKGTDFDFSYTNNVNVPATPNAPPTVTITGKGNYTGSNSKTFTIIKATPVVTAPTAKSLTYTGAAQALVNPGSTTLGTLQYSLDDRTYGTDVPTSTDAGSYTVYYRVVGDGNINDVATQSITATIAKVTPTVTAPTAKAGLLFNGAAQELVNAGSTTGGTLEYSLDNQTYSTTIPSATNVGTYTVYYRVVGNANYNDVAPQSVTATIASSESSIVTYPTANTGLVYNGTAQALITAGSATNGTMQYSLDGQNYSTTIPAGTNAGSYDVWYMVKGNAGYSDVAPAKLTVTIAKAQATVRYNPYEFTAKIGETFYPPYATLDPRDLTLTYWSADKDVATVNAQTGEVTLIAPGKVNIYAEFAGDENYEAAQDYYILTVLQRDIEPIDEDVTILMNDENLLYTDDEGNKKEIKLDNAVIYDILFTLNISGNPSESDGYDETEQCVVLNHPMKENDVNRIIIKDVKPGTDEYADEYTGMTFRVPAGKGYVIIDSRTDGEYQMMVKIGELAPVAFNHPNREKDSVFYECSAPTWVYVYNGGKVSNARMEASHRAKKTKGYVKIYSVTRSSSVGDGIERINMDALEASDRWYDLQGNRINRPTKKGVYILRGQKIVVR